MLLRPFAHTLTSIIQVMYGLPVIGTRSQSAGPSGSSCDSDLGDQLLQGNTEISPPPAPPQGTAPLPQGTVTLTAEQCAATQAMMARVGTIEASLANLNNQTSQSQSHDPHSDLGRRMQLKPKIPDVYAGTSHKELHEFLRQCTEHFEVLNVEINSPASIAFAAALIREATTGPVWEDYRSSLPPGHVVTWDEFKKALRDDLGDEDAFIDKSWGKFFNFHQRPHESVMIRLRRKLMRDRGISAFRLRFLFQATYRQPALTGITDIEWPQWQKESA